MPPGECAALLIIDMISPLDFPDAARIAPSAVRAARRIRALREACHARAWPVVFANDHFAHWRADFRELTAMAEAAGGDAAEIVSLIAPQPEDYFVLKPRHSAFLATSLAVLLATLGVRRLLLTGMALEGCVLATALDANARAYEVAVVRDAVAGKPALRRATLSVLEGSHAAHVLGGRAAAIDWASRSPR